MQSFIIALLICSVTMSALALIYMALTPLLAKRYSVKGRYYTWLVVVLGFIIPFRPQWGKALIQVDVPGTITAPAMRLGGQLGSPAGSQVIGQIGNTQIESIAPVTVTPSLENAALTSVLPDIAWWQIATVVWLVGLIAFVIYHVIKHYCFAKIVRRWSERITGEQELALLQSLQAEMGISKQIGLYRCASIGSPMMIGFINPRILLPKTGLTPDALRLILKHELVHYQCKDLYYKCLVLIATAIHWFNPVVWWMAKAIEILCELSCDAATVRSTDAGMRQYYSETIIALVRHRSTPKTVLSTNFYGSRKGMKKRILSIMDMGKKKAGFAIFCLTLTITLGMGLAICGSVNAQTLPAVGDTIHLGGLEWRVLEVKDGNALVLSDKVLFISSYHSLDISTSWEECALRQYLNGEFYDAAFSTEEKGRIVETAVQNNDNPWYLTPGGSDTIDKVFLLSIDEVAQYYGDSGKLEQRQSNGATFISDQFNEERIAQTSVGEASLWWLRSPGRSYFTCDAGSHNCAAAITASGSLSIQGNYVDNESCGVRPALWLKL